VNGRTRCDGKNDGDIMDDDGDDGIDDGDDDRV
jgi:hypothetical protein